MPAWLPIENGRTEYDFPVYPCYGVIQADGSHRSYISLTEIREKEGIAVVDNLRDYSANEKTAFYRAYRGHCYELTEQSYRLAEYRFDGRQYAKSLWNR